MFLFIFAVWIVVVLFVKRRYKRIVIDIVCEKFLIWRKRKILSWTRKILRDTLRKWILRYKNLILLWILRSILRRQKNVRISRECLSITWRLTILKSKEVIRWAVFKVWFWISIKTLRILNLLLNRFHLTLICDLDCVLFNIVNIIVRDIFEIFNEIFSSDVFVKSSNVFAKFFIQRASNLREND